MRQLLRIVPALAFATLVAVASPPVAYGSSLTFAFDVDRFELTGQWAGSSGYVNEFNGSVIDYPWEIYMGTAVESGGVVTLKNPGEPVDLVFPDFTINLERSDIRNYNKLFDGEGDFLATSSWIPVIPQPREFFGLWFLYYTDPFTYVADAILYGYADPVTAALVGIPSGLVVLAFEYDTHLAVQTSFSAQAFSFAPSDVTGSVELRLGFDDANDLINRSYSLDGGATFIDFSPIASRMAPIGQMKAGGYLGLIADPFWAVPEPTTALLLATGLAGLAALQRWRRQ